MSDTDYAKSKGGVCMKDFNSFENYLNELGKFQFLTAEEERELLIKAQSGNKKAMEKIVHANLRFVVDQAKKMLRTGCNVDIEDLIAAGNIGLVKAVSKFKMEKEVRFITCASYWILAEMREEIGKNHAIRLPHNCQVMLSKIRAAEEELPEGISREEGYEYIACKTGTTKKTVRAILESTGIMISLDSLVTADGDGSLYDFVEDPYTADPLDAVIANDLSENFRKVYKSLPADEQKVLECHFGLKTGEPMSLDEIARNWTSKITREGIRQKELKALRRFSKAENISYFEDYFGKAV